STPHTQAVKMMRKANTTRVYCTISLAVGQTTFLISETTSGTKVTAPPPGLPSPSPLSTRTTRLFWYASVDVSAAPERWRLPVGRCAPELSVTVRMLLKKNTYKDLRRSY